MDKTIPAGMTLRDYLACHAPAQTEWTFRQCEEITGEIYDQSVTDLKQSVAYAMKVDAILRYRWADAMMEARSK
jgi:hypothetical protein